MADDVDVLDYEEEAGQGAQTKRFKLSQHPGDEYVRSLEPQSLQVLVRKKKLGVANVTFDLHCTADIFQICQLLL